MSAVLSEVIFHLNFGGNGRDILPKLKHILRTDTNWSEINGIGIVYVEFRQFTDQFLSRNLHKSKRCPLPQQSGDVHVFQPKERNVGHLIEQSGDGSASDQGPKATGAVIRIVIAGIFLRSDEPFTVIRLWRTDDRRVMSNLAVDSAL